MASGDKNMEVEILHQELDTNDSEKQKEYDKPESPKAGCSKEGEAESLETPARPESPDPNCSICLSAMTNKSFTDTCFHTFCFICLLEWSKVNPVCPLCKKSFKSIIHTVTSIDQYEQYYLPPPDQQRPETPSPPPPPDVSMRIWESAGVRFRYATTLVNDPWGDYNDHRYWRSRRHDAVIGLDPREFLAHNRAHTFHTSRRRSQRSRVCHSLFNRMRENHTRDFRRRIYMEGLWAIVPDSTRRFRDISPEFFSRNPAQTHRLVPWLNRELNAILYDQEESVGFALQLVMEMTKRYAIQSDEMHQHLESILGLHTRHFLHEYFYFARSPFDITDYDRHYEYEQFLNVADSERESDEDQGLQNSRVGQHMRSQQEGSPGRESSENTVRGARRRKSSRTRRNADASQSTSITQGTGSSRSSAQHAHNTRSSRNSNSSNVTTMSNTDISRSIQRRWQPLFRAPEPEAERRQFYPVDITPAPIITRVRHFLDEILDPNNASTSNSGWESPVLSRPNIFSSPPRPKSPEIDVVSVISTPKSIDPEQNSSPEYIDHKSPEEINPGSPEINSPGYVELMNPESDEDVKPGSSGWANMLKEENEEPSGLLSSNTHTESDSDVQFIKFEKPWGERTPIQLSSGPDSDIELLTKSLPFKRRRKEKNGGRTRSRTRSPSRNKRSGSRSKTPLQYREGRYKNRDRDERHSDRYSSKSRGHRQQDKSRSKHRSESGSRDYHHSNTRKNKSGPSKSSKSHKRGYEGNTRSSQVHDKHRKSRSRSKTGERDKSHRYLDYHATKKHHEKRSKSPNALSKHRHKKKKDKRDRSGSVELVTVKRNHGHKSRSKKSKKSKNDGLPGGEGSALHVVGEVLSRKRRREVGMKLFFKKNPTGHKSSSKKLSSKIVPANHSSGTETVTITSPLITSPFGSPVVTGSANSTGLSSPVYSSSVSISSAGIGSPPVSGGGSTMSTGFSSPLNSNQSSSSECVQALGAKATGFTGTNCNQSSLMQSTKNMKFRSALEGSRVNDTNDVHASLLTHMNTNSSFQSHSKENGTECVHSPIKQTAFPSVTSPVSSNSGTESAFSPGIQNHNRARPASPSVNITDDEHILSPVMPKSYECSAELGSPSGSNYSDIIETASLSESQKCKNAYNSGDDDEYVKAQRLQTGSASVSHLHSPNEDIEYMSDDLELNEFGTGAICQDDWQNNLAGDDNNYFSESAESLSPGQYQSNTEQGFRGQSDDTEDFDQLSLLDVDDTGPQTESYHSASDLDEIEKQLRKSIQSRLFQ